VALPVPKTHPPWWEGVHELIAGGRDHVLVKLVINTA
jgi:hypothetical protein